LESIAINNREFLLKTAVIVVVNNPLWSERPDKALYEDNLKTIEYLEKHCSGLNLFIVRAIEHDFSLPSSMGVGLARRIGMDLALDIIDLDNEVSPLLICLDSDAPVLNNYLEKIYEIFEPVKKKKRFKRPGHGGVVNYAHRIPRKYEQARAISGYEIYLRYYRKALEFIGSVYDFHTIGSTMVSSAEGYLSVGGMPAINACEDFYFMLKLSKFTNILKIRDTLVMPSSRAEIRAPIGTGCHVKNAVESNIPQLAPAPESFLVLKEWLEKVIRNNQISAEKLISKANDLNPLFGEYLDSRSFATAWERIKKNSASEKNLLKQFHTWFDAFKIMRILNLLNNQVPVIDAVLKLFNIKYSALSSEIIDKQFFNNTYYVKTLKKEKKEIIIKNLSVLSILRKEF
jgi:hypothetical protein